MSDLKTALKNIFVAPQPTSRVATVIRRIRVGRYELQDGSGRLMQADTDRTWKPGDSVIVQSGRIVASAASSPTVRTYEV